MTPSEKNSATRPAEDPASNAIGRRSFAKAFVAAAAAGAGNLGAISHASDNEDRRDGRNSEAEKRRNDAFRIRVEAASMQKMERLPSHPDNGDEDRYPTKCGSYSKGLPHNDLGEVDPGAYRLFLRAVDLGSPAAFEAIPSGCPVPSQRRKLVNPQAGLAFDLEGADSHALAIPSAPAFASAEAAGEILENYWMALCRDVPFARYTGDPFTSAAAGDLSAAGDFRGPKAAGQVTPGTLFRGLTPGDLAGPYISQFLYQPVPFGATFIEQRMRTYAPGIDFMTGYPEWLNIQRGYRPAYQEQFDPEMRYIRNGRDLSQWVHMDVLYQAYLHAMNILLTPPSPASLGGMGAPFDASNPYRTSQNQEGFATFGPPHLAALMTEVASRALKAVWYQKWFVHRRLRPEVFAGRVHNHMTGAARYPIGTSDLLRSPVLPLLKSKYDSYLLPMAFPEGSPLHPAYGAGHATVAGACVTILKAWFDESFVIPDPVVPDEAGTSLVAYSGPPLTVGGELNKLASNIAIGRNHAGVHWRSDATESLKLGEALAISILRDQRATYNERFNGFTLTKFNGQTITV